MRTDPIPPACMFLGVEGGGTRTIAILADARERLVSRIETGPANLKLMTDDDLAAHFANLAVQLSQPVAVCIGLAGLRTDRDRSRVIEAARKAWPVAHCRPCSDLETAMAAAAPSRIAASASILVLSGTGSCCFGKALDGGTAKLGGWGHILGDKGSAYEIGLRALKACVYYYDREGAWPELGARLLRALHLNDPEELVSWVQRAEKREIAALALEVFAAWKQRDRIASDILNGAAASLAKDASDCAGRLVRNGASVQFILAGGVLLKQERFAKLVSGQLLERWPKAEITRLQVEGAWGAVRLAIAEWRMGTRSKNVSMPSIDSLATRASAKVPQPAFALPSATALSPTERRNRRSARLDKLPLTDAIDLMLREEGKALRVLARERRLIARCVRLVAEVLQNGGRLFYVGAGTSGRLGTLDASECPPTFRSPPDQVQAIMAGGQQALWQSIEGAEDDAAAGSQAIRFRAVTDRDIVIGIAASGRTPFVWGALGSARELGAKTVLVCFNPFLRITRAYRPDLVLALDLGPEVLTGSTRLKAGTATKLLLNIFTTLSMVRMGKVISNLMVDLNPSNEKLRDRAVRIVRELTNASTAEARQALEQSGWVIKAALPKFGWPRKK